MSVSTYLTIHLDTLLLLALAVYARAEVLLLSLF
jgi:hypothetical protein